MPAIPVPLTASLTVPAIEPVPVVAGAAAVRRPSRGSSAPGACGVNPPQPDADRPPWRRLACAPLANVNKATGRTTSATPKIRRTTGVPPDLSDPLLTTAPYPSVTRVAHDPPR